jgi:FlaA1/EpsC-like NDP-sugar epimerase
VSTIRPSRRIRYSLLLAVDIAAIALALTISHSLIEVTPQIGVFLAAIVIQGFVYHYFGLYRRLWQHAGIPELIRITLAVVLGTAASALVAESVVRTSSASPLSTSPAAFWMLTGLMTLSMVGGVRFMIRALSEHERRPDLTTRTTEGVPTILYGAGRSGMMVVRHARDGRAGIRPVGILDDDERFHGSHVAELKVHGGLDAMERLAVETGARRVVLTVPDAPGEVVRRVIHEATRLGLEVRIIPRAHELFDGSLDAYKLRRVKVEDLLHRPAHSDHEAGVAELVTGRVAMITGAGGSIGSELARQVSALHPSRLILVDRAEGPLYGIQRELELAARRGLGSGAVVAHIANVATRLTMRRIIRDHQPHVIFHAAAYKHVPMMEEHPSDAVHVNIGGTMSVLDAAEAHGVPHFVFVSTDKAVRPTSVMGATKRVAEALVTDSARRTGLRYVSVRFGNVLGSSGSVVPIFQQQLANGDPLTITHPEMTRYFMTIPEAVWLILDAAAIGPPGSLLALDMGEPVRIVDLAADLIRLSGLNPDTVPVEYTGLRPGEKLHEQLFYDAEQVKATRNSKVMLAASVASIGTIRDDVAALIASADGDHDAALRSQLFQLTDALEHAGRQPEAPAATAPRPRREAPATMVSAFRE